MPRHLALFTALALASANEGELRLSLTYNDMADDDDSTTLSAHFDEPLSRVHGDGDEDLNGRGAGMGDASWGRSGLFEVGAGGWTGCVKHMLEAREIILGHRVR